MASQTPHSFDMRYLILALALVFGLGNYSDDAVQELVNEGKDIEAFALAEEGAQSGDASAHEWLGWLYDNGRGVEENPGKAVEHYRVAIAGGRNYARWRVGVMIDQGATEGSLEEAVDLFTTAADDGFTNAMVSLALMQATGRGTTQDYEAALANYMRASRAGNAHGVRGVGIMRYNGEGLNVDKQEAAAWFLVSAVHGNSEGENSFRMVASELEGVDFRDIGRRANAIAEELGLPGRVQLSDEGEEARPQGSAS